MNGAVAYARVAAWQLNLAMLLAATRDVAAVTSGVTSGPGNQGSANTAHLIGQAGTGMAAYQMQRALAYGQVGYP
jgi:hypothetical protein